MLAIIYRDLPIYSPILILGLFFSSFFLVRNCHLKFENYTDSVSIEKKMEEFKNMNFLHSVREHKEFHGKYSLSFRATS